MGIWRNIGKIVILSIEIIYQQVKWYIGSWKQNTTKKSNTPKQEVKNIYLNEEDESRERSKLMVELCEQPFYDIKPE